MALDWAAGATSRTNSSWVRTPRSGLPISAGKSGANLCDSQALIPLVKGISPIRSRRGKPGKLHADKGYDYAHLRRWLRERGITHRIARKGVESS